MDYFSAASPAASKEISYNRPRILIVEDKETWREKYKELLSKRGYEPVFANYGRIAVEIFSKDPAAFALVISDLDLDEDLPEGVPDMPGEEVIAKIRKIRAEIPIIVISTQKYDIDNVNYVRKKYQIEANPEILLEIIKKGLKIQPATEGGPLVDGNRGLTASPLERETEKENEGRLYICFWKTFTRKQKEIIRESAVVILAWFYQMLQKRDCGE